MDWQAIGAIATAVSALVTAGTIVFIARQTSATRQSAEAAEETAKTAVDALDVARREGERSRFLAVEAVRGRLDDRLPRIRVQPEPSATWPPRQPSNFADGEAQPINGGPTYVLPRDANKLLMLVIGVSVTNDGLSPARVRFSPPLHYEKSMVTDEVLQPGTSLTGLRIEIIRSVNAWIAIYEDRDATRGPGEESFIDITNYDPADAGVDELHRIVVRGTLLRHVRNQVGAWEFINQPQMPFVLKAGDDGVGNVGWNVLPATRRYFLSRVENAELPAPDIT